MWLLPLPVIPIRARMAARARPPALDTLVRALATGLVPSLLKCAPLELLSCLVFFVATVFLLLRVTACERV